MDCAAIIAVILKLIQDCRNEQSDEDVKAAIRRPGLLPAIALRRALRKQGLRGRELRDTFREVLAKGRDATDEELDELLEDAAELVTDAEA